MRRAAPSFRLLHFGAPGYSLYLFVFASSGFCSKAKKQYPAPDGVPCRPRRNHSKPQKGCRCYPCPDAKHTGPARNGPGSTVKTRSVQNPNST